MSELARTPEKLRHLFDEINFGSHSQHAVVQRALDIWRERRGNSLLPTVTDLSAGLDTSAREASFIATTMPGGDYRLSEIGAEARKIFVPQHDPPTLSKIGNQRLAVRLRDLIAIALERVEPVSATFGGRLRGNDSSVEVLVAPVRNRSGFCVVSEKSMRAQSAGAAA